MNTKSKSNIVILSKTKRRKHKKYNKKTRGIYKHSSGGVTGVAVDTNHSTGFGVELEHEVRLLLQYLVVLPHKVGPHLTTHRSLV